MDNSFVGKQIGHYRIDALLGRGGMGAVYQAFDLNLARMVALKVMHSHLAEEERFKQRFMQEAQAAARLDHPSIVNIHDFGQDGDLLYMVMTYVEGGTLAVYIQELEKHHKLANLDEILFLLSQVADALGYAHAQGVLHRDVKPDNILVKELLRPERSGEPALRAVMTDFGLAKLLTGGMQTATGVLLGTMNYISPEVCKGEQPGLGSDIYALGVMLYHLVTGKPPYKITSLSEAVVKHVNELPPMPTVVRPDLPPPLEVVINKAMAKNPADRYQTPEEMASLMRRIRAMMADGPTTKVDRDTIVLSVSDQLATGQIVTAAPAPKPEPPPTTLEVPKREPEPARLKIVLRPNRLTVSPGRKVSAEINLVNAGGTAASVRLGVEEVPVSWIKIRQDTIHLPAGSQQSLSMVINPPLDSSATAGQHRFWVRAFSSTDRQIMAEVGGLLLIPTFERFAAELQPSKIKSGETARLLVRNDSNRVTSFQVGGEDPQNNLSFESLTNQLEQIGPGQVGMMDMRIRARKEPFIGRTKTAPFHIQIKGASVQQQIQGQLEIKPRIPIAIIAVVLILICMSGAVGTFVLLNSGLFGTADVEGTNEASALVESLTPSAPVIDPAVQTVEAQGTVLAITAEAEGDNDNDGLANLVEEAIGTDPDLADSDNDGLLDGEEINQYNSDPLASDTDQDGLTDGDEIQVYHTSVNNPDTDGDSFMDGDEVADGSDPLAQPTNTPTITSSPTATPTVAPTPTQTATPTRQPTGAGTGGGLPLGFESFGVWGRGDQANGTITQSSQQSYSGGSSAKISYDFATDGNDFVVFLQFNDMPGQPTGLNVWVYGDGSGHYLNAWIIDDEGQTWQVPFGRVTHTGWAQMSGQIDTDQDWPWTHISGPNNDVIDYPIRFRGFALDDVNDAYIGQGEIYLDDLTAVE